MSVGVVLLALGIAQLAGWNLKPRWVDAFAVFALTMASLMLLVSGLVAASRQTLITRLKAATPRIKSVASVLLILVGTFNIATTVNLGLFLRTLFP